jgi:hypothetical protein
VRVGSRGAGRAHAGAWDVQLKSLVDRATVRVLVTGSSALRIGLGRDSLAGRIQPFEVGPLRLSEIAALRGFGDLPPAQGDNGTADWLRQEFWSDLGEHARRHAGVLDRAYASFSERVALHARRAQLLVDERAERRVGRSVRCR